CQHSYNTPYSF
nr:immunoglobulin light chain junction region [Macaca mulatta]MOV79614.1 immunoglobulin light chain junction region [Macaca mulatta]MOV85688.1 immunoglobulin light chain junction region [Macaca mulatta]